MANFLQQIKLDEELYDLHDSEFIMDNRAAGGAALTGVSKAPALFDGMQITYWLAYAAGSSATLNLTLADGSTTGAIPCYYSGTTRMGTQYAAGNAIHFTYRENVTIGSTTVTAGWWGDANYSVSDTNYDIIGTSIPIKTRLNAYCLCGMVGTSGTIAKQTNTVGAGTYWEINAFTQSSGTSTSKKLVPNQGYYPGKIFYYTGSSAITDADSVSGTISGGTSNVDLRYTVNGSTSANIGVTGAPFFLVGSLGSDGLFYPNGHASQATKEWWQCGFPTDLTSTYIYWYVGMMSSKYQCRLSDHNWMLKSDGTKWIVFDGAMSSDVSWSDITGKPTSFTPASHSHGYISNDGSIPAAIAASPASGDKIVITDSSDSDKVRGSIAIGSDDGKFLKHDGTWDFTDDHILVMTGTPTGALTSAPITTTTSWSDYQTAVTNHDRLVLDIPLANTVLELQWQEGNNLNAIAHMTSNSGNTLVSTAVFTASNNNGNVQFSYNSNVRSYALGADRADYADNAYYATSAGTATSADYATSAGSATTADTANSVDWFGVQNPPTIPDIPDAPVSDGNYVLNVNGSSSWQEETKEVVEIVFDSVTQATIGTISGPVLYSSTTTYTESLSLCQNKIVKLRILGTLIDAMMGTQGSGDIVDLVTSAGLPDSDSFKISYDTSIKINLVTGTLENTYVKGQVLIYSLDGSATGACCVPVLWLVSGQSYFQTIGSVTGFENISVPVLTLNNGLLGIGSQTYSTISGSSTCKFLIMPD